MLQGCDGVSGRAMPRVQGKDRFVSAREILIRVFNLLGEWQDRRHERRQLMGMSERGLHDLGLTRDGIDAEAAKPFWKS
jgi:uncharacterized protein YjiS (DUF1127 family)